MNNEFAKLQAELRSIKPRPIDPRLLTRIDQALARRNPPWKWSDWLYAATTAAGAAAAVVIIVLLASQGLPRRPAGHTALRGEIISRQPVTLDQYLAMLERENYGRSLMFPYPNQR